MNKFLYLKIWLLCVFFNVDDDLYFRFLIFPGHGFLLQVFSKVFPKESMEMQIVDLLPKRI